MRRRTAAGNNTERKFWTEQLEGHQRNLRTLQKQRLTYGAGEAPLRLLNQIAAEEQEIAKIQAQLEQLSSPQSISIEVEQASASFARTPFQVQLLQRGAGRMEVRGLLTPGGQPKAEVQLPFSPVELKAVLKALDLGAIIPGRFKPDYLQSLARLGLLKGERLRADFHQQVGQKLYQSLFSGEILTGFKMAEGAGKPVACQLRFDPEDVILAQFPWELVYEGNMPLVPVKGGVELTRYITFADQPTPLQAKLPLRILFISPRPGDDNALPDEAEKKALLTGLATLREQGKLTWQALEPPTWDAFEERLNAQSFDIIHFDGHGAFARLCPACGKAHYPGAKTCAQCGGDMSDAVPEGHLHFEDEDGNLDRVSVSDLKVILADSRTRLMVLTACQSGVVQGVSVFNGAAPGLIEAGVPAVVAMQGSPPVKTMLKFVKRFYQSLAGGQCIPEAVNRGRLAIYREKPPAWFMPVVYLRSSDQTYGQLFNI